MTCWREVGKPLEYERTAVPAASLAGSALVHAALLIGGGFLSVTLISSQVREPVLHAARAEISIAISGPSPQPITPTEAVRRPPPPERRPEVPREEAPGPAVLENEPAVEQLERLPAELPEQTVEFVRFESEPPRGGVIAAEALRGEERPRYPERARRLGIEGAGLYEIDVNERGRVDAVRVLRSAGHADFDESVKLFFLLRARYSPATLEGVPIPYTIRQEVSFQLKAGR